MGALVGRDAELGQLRRALDVAASGQGRLILVTGPAGIGKSRLADAAILLAADRGMPAVRGAAVDDPGAPPLWPWLRAMRGWPGTADLSAANLGDSSAARRFELFTGVAERLAERAGATGLLVVLEDLHWADRTSVLLLRHIAGMLTELPVALVVTLRDGPHPAINEVVPHLLRGDVAGLLSVPPLAAADIAAWLPRLTGGRDDDLAAALHERTGGNPLLVRLVAEDLAGRGSGTGALDRLMAERPQLRRLVGARVAGLGDGPRQAVEAAAVLGEQVNVTIVARVLDRPAVEVGVLLDEAAAAGILRARAMPGPQASVDPGLAFEHALVRDAVYEELPPAERSRLHAAAAAALAEVGDERLAGSIARHWERVAGPVARAQCVAWAKRAGDQARAGFAFEDAVGYAELAVESASAAGCDDAELARLLVTLAEAMFADNRMESSLSACERAAELAERAGRPDLVAAAGLVIHGVGDGMVVTVTPRICERALALLPPDDHVTRARLIAQLAVGVAQTRGGPEAGDLAAAALSEAELSGDDTAELEALAARHIAIAVPGTVEERLRLGARAVALGASAKQPMAALWGHLWRADGSQQLGKLHEFDNEVAAIEQVARQHRSALAQWHLHRHLALRSLTTGDIVGAQDQAEAALRLARPMGDFSLIGMFYAFSVQLCVLLHDPAVLPDDALDVISHAPPMPLIRVSTPIIHGVRGDLERARAGLGPLRHIPRTMPIGTRWFGTVFQIGVAGVLVDDVELAADVHDLLRPYVRYYHGDGSGAVFFWGSIARIVGDFALAAGRIDDAEQHYRDGLAMDERIGARPFAALARLGLAKTLAAGTGDRRLDEAAALAVSAADEFRRLGMTLRLRQADDLARRIAHDRRSVSPLTEREEEIAGLVAVPLSNREIASRLFLSERTVETHVRNILAKLGFASRTEITAWKRRA